MALFDVGLDVMMFTKFGRGPNAATALYKFDVADRVRLRNDFGSNRYEGLVAVDLTVMMMLCVSFSALRHFFPAARDVIRGSAAFGVVHG